MGLQQEQTLGPNSRIQCVILIVDPAREALPSESMKGYAADRQAAYILMSGHIESAHVEANGLQVENCSFE